MLVLALTGILLIVLGIVIKKYKLANQLVVGHYTGKTDDPELYVNSVSNVLIAMGSVMIAFILIDYFADATLIEIK